MADITPKATDFLYQSGRDELFPLGRHEKHCFNIRIELDIHADHLKLVFEIRNGPQPAEDRDAPQLAAKSVNRPLKDWTFTTH